VSIAKVYADITVEHCTDDDEATVMGLVYGGHGKIDEITVEWAKCQTCQDEIVLSERDYLRAEDAIEKEVSRAA
jgi:hypothetical protein